MACPPSSPTDTTAPTSTRLRLSYLDGLRGLAALYVTLHHAYLQVDWPAGTLSGLARASVHWLQYGKFSVDVFIVLSGYCLMLPVVCSGRSQLQGGFWGYLKRRGRRILPPYYAALVLCILLTFLVPGLWNGGSSWQMSLTPNILISHLLLLHNLKAGWQFQINYPMWSVATEWQIYFLFPLVLLPLWRKFGISVTVMVAFALGFSPHFLLQGYLDWASPWFLGLFSLGMGAAVLNFSPNPNLTRIRRSIPWGWVTVISGIALMVATWPRSQEWLDRHEALTDPAVGFVAASLLVYCTQFLIDQKPAWPLILRFFASPWLVFLGTFSYSLYLTHAPVLALGDLGMRYFQIIPAVRLAVLLLIASPVAILFAYGFHLAFERRFMTHHKPNAT